MEPDSEECLKDDFQMDDIVKQRLKSCEVTTKGLITGYVDSREDYDNLIRDLKVFGYSFAVRSCSVGDPEKGALKFKSVSTDVQIPFFGSPFHIEGTTYFLCAQGNKYYKTRDDREREKDNREKILPDIDDPEDIEKGYPKKKRRRARETIKMGCPARMTVKCVRVYPDYKTTMDSWRRKSDVLQRLKADLKLVPPPRNEVRYWIALSPENTHTHKRNSTQKIQSLHPDLILEIHTLVMRGVTSVRVIKAHLRNVVERMFAGSSLKPDPSNSAFYPSDKSVYNHSHEAKLLRFRMENNGGTKDTNSEKQSNGSKRESETRPNPTPELPVTLRPAAPSPPPAPVTQPAAQPAMAMMENTFAGEWQDTQMLTPNLVQVNGDGTIVYVMAQQIENVDASVGGAVDGAIHDAANGLMSVKMDDNSYIVSVLPESSTGRLVSLNDGSEVVSTASLHLSNVLDDVGDGQSVVGLLDRGNDGSRVITLEGNVVNSVGDDQKQSHFSQLEPPTITGVFHHQLEPMSYSNHILPTTLEEANEELSRKALEESLEDKEKREDILELIREQELKLHQGEEDSEEEVERFDKGQQTDEVEDQPEPIILNEEEQQQLQMLQQEQQQQQQQEQQQQNEETTKEQRAVLSLRAALRDCAQDVINMSYSCANHALLQEAFNVLDSCRQRMIAEQERRQKGVIYGEVRKRPKAVRQIRGPIKSRRHPKPTRRSCDPLQVQPESRKIFKPNIIRDRKAVDTKTTKSSETNQQWASPPAQPELRTTELGTCEPQAELRAEQRETSVVTESYVLYQPGVGNSLKPVVENDSDEYDLVISEG